MTAFQDAIKKGMTLEQVNAAKLTLDFDGRWGATTGPWTTDMFVEAVYKSLQQEKQVMRRLLPRWLPRDPGASTLSDRRAAGRAAAPRCHRPPRVARRLST